MIPNYIPNQYGVNSYNSVMYPEKTTSSTLSKRLLQAVVDFTATIICFFCYALVLFLLEPRIAYYTCDMSGVSFPYIPDTISFVAVIFYGGLPPILFILLIELGNAKLLPFQNKKAKSSRGRQFLITSFHGLSLYLFGMGITLLLTEIGKKWVGRLRPHFLAICKPAVTSITCTSNTATGFIYVASSTGGSFCTNTDVAAVREARLSFPSGHSSFITYTMIFLMFYLQARLYLLRFRFIKALLQITAFITAYVTAISRILDYHHRGSDVIGGMLLGAGVAIFIIYYVGRVLWVFERDVPYSDFDFKPNSDVNVRRVMGSQQPVKVLPDRFKFQDLNNI